MLAVQKYTNHVNKFILKTRRKSYALVIWKYERACAILKSRNACMLERGVKDAHRGGCLAKHGERSVSRFSPRNKIQVFTWLKEFLAWSYSMGSNLSRFNLVAEHGLCLG